MLPENWNELDVEKKNSWLKSELAERIEVTFTKVDGTQRVMNCTLKEDLLPERKATGSTRAVNHEVISVWDLDQNAWKSFRVSNVTQVKNGKESS